LKLLKSLNSENRALERNNDDLKNNEIIKRKRNNFSLIGSSGLLIFLRIVYLGTFVYGALMIFNGQLTYGSLTGLIQLVSFIEGPLTNFNAIINSYNSFKISKERIDEVLSLQDEVKQVELNDFDEIIFKNVSFSYENNQIFKNFNYTIKKNDSILIKGKSGRGKSTLFNLLLGFIEPDEGEILVRYKNQTYSIKETRTLFSLVNQDNILFSGSVRDNIYLLSEERDEEKIIRALKIANIYDELMEKKNKLDTKLIERGGGLSLGQIQRVALAISILNNKKILLLDEFTSSLDSKLEENIVLSISKLEKTKLIITHHNIEIDGSKVLNLDYE
ncbi:MAG: ABC transporter ATP-binding protein, partial [bacterium]|nr:ABC transporter ATP-binding protein [bacterium]